MTTVRPHRLVLLVSFVIGIAGSWAYVTAVTDYRDTADAYTNVDIVAGPGSLAWTDEGRRSATVTLRIANDSRTNLTVEHLELRLYTGDAFAGAMYEPWEDLVVAAGATEEIELVLEVTTPEERLPESGAPRITGDAHLAFEGIDQPFVVRFSDELEGATGG